MLRLQLAFIHPIYMQMNFLKSPYVFRCVGNLMHKKMHWPKKMNFFASIQSSLADCISVDQRFQIEIPAELYQQSSENLDIIVETKPKNHKFLLFPLLE